MAASALYGANHGAAPLTLTALQAALLGAWMILSERARRTIGEGAVLTWPAVCFGLTLLVAAWSLTPWTPGGPPPVWSWVDSLGAATLDRGATLVEMLKLCGLACLFLVGFIQGARAGLARATLQALMVIGAVYAFLSLVAFLADGEHTWQARRLFGGFLSANSAGTLFGALTLIGVSWLIQSLRPPPPERPRPTAQALFITAAPRAALAILFAGCLLLTASRGAIVATGGLMVVYLAWEAMTGGLKGRAGAAMATTWVAYLGVLLAGAGAVAVTRFDRFAADLAERGAILALHWEMFLASPLFGWGLGTFDLINQQIMTSESHDILWKLRATHNVVLQWLEEAGIVGSIPMFLCIAAVIALTWMGLRQRQESRSWIRALLLVDALFLIHGMSDFALQVPALSALWAFLLGLQLSMAHPLSRRRLSR
jgi:O-antigen ligase